MNTDKTDVQTTLAKALEEFWQSYTGVRPVKVRIVLGEQAVAILLIGVLSPAEQQFATTKANRDILSKVGQRILEQAEPQLLHLVEESVHSDATLIDVHLDVAKGNLVGFFSLE